MYFFINDDYYKVLLCEHKHSAGSEIYNLSCYYREKL